MKPSPSSQYSIICHDLLDQKITPFTALQSVMQLIKKISSLPKTLNKYPHLMKAMYGLALDLCKQTHDEHYSQVAKEAIELDTHNYAFRVHLRDSHSDGSLRFKIWSAEWVTMHSKAVPFDHALYQALLSTITITEGATVTTNLNPFDKMVQLLLTSLSLPPTPFPKHQYEEYGLELQASTWNDLINRTIDTVEKAHGEVFTRSIRVSIHEELSSQATGTQRTTDSQRASKRIRSIASGTAGNVVEEKKKKFDREALMRVLGVDEQFIKDIEDIPPPTAHANECKGEEEEVLQVPESFINVTELIIWELTQLLNNTHQISSEQVLNKFRDICMTLDKSVYPSTDFYINVLLFFAERLSNNEQELGLLQCIQGRKDEKQRITKILARNAESQGNLSLAQELWMNVDGEEGEHALRVLGVKQAILDKTVVKIENDIPSELQFDYHLAMNDCDAAFNTFVANPSSLSPSLLSQLHTLTVPQAQFMVVWCWKNFSEVQSRACLLNALHQIPLNEPRTLLEWIEEPDECLVRHLIKTSTEKEFVYACWSCLYGLPPLLNATEPPFINCDAQPVMTLRDWMELSRLCLQIYDDEEMQADIHPVTWDRLLTYATSTLKFPTPNFSSIEDV